MSQAENIKIMCPNLVCGKVLAVPGAARGRVVRCRHCGTTLRIPGAAPAAPAPVQDPAAEDANTDSTAA